MHVVVVGSGIVGAAIAYELGTRDINVTVCEKSHVGAGSTGAGGGIRSQFSTPVNVAFSRASIDFWDDIEEEFAIDVREQINGYLFLAQTEETSAQLKRDVEIQQEHGFANEFLEPKEATNYCPGLNTEPYIAATYSPEDRFVDPNLALRGYVDAASDAGAVFEFNSEVQAIQTRNGEVTAVKTSQGSIECDYVVNAAGAWANKINQLVDLNLPVEPRVRYQLLVRPGTSYTQTLPLTMDVDTGAVFYPEDAETMITSGPQETMPKVDPDRNQKEPSTEWTIETLENLSTLSDYFGDETRVQSPISGVYAQTPDSNPIIDEPIPGFVTAIGFSGHGFMHAPATGQVVSELILDGVASLTDIAPFSTQRFASEKSETEQSFI